MRTSLSTFPPLALQVAVVVEVRQHEGAQEVGEWWLKSLLLVA
jgi:hypothetical protein